MAGLLSTAGLAAFLLLGLGALVDGTDADLRQEASMAEDPRAGVVRFLATGDINLGRFVGQQILAGDTLYPFAQVKAALAPYDFVFSNLECQLSEQGGETQHRRNNLIFTGPPGGGAALRLGGITHVSTANNHALDYGIEALEETIENLNREGIVFSGTAGQGGDPYAPALFTINQVRFALFSCTAVMNMEDRFWTQYVAEADTARLFPRIRETRPDVDFLLLSYHGGAEYAEGPSGTTRSFAHTALKAGVDLFLGHHPHVPQGIEQVGGKLIVYSLGNFVFSQPFAFWTQRSFALETIIRRDRNGTRIEGFRCLPLLAANQPQFLEIGGEHHVVRERIDRLSRSLQGGVGTWPN
jgi:poly-gamma-glutamate synthesis protein (capsule biosynthesis protein)